MLSPRTVWPTLRPGAVLTRTGTSNSQLVVLGAKSELSGGFLDGAGIPVYVVGIGGNGATVQGSRISGATYGIGCGSWDDLSVIDNDFVNVPSYALLCEGASARPRFSGNRVTNLLGGQGQGAMFKDGPTDGVMVGNTVNVGGTVGLEAFGASTMRTAITGNVVNGATIGISIAASIESVVSGNMISNASTYGVEAAEGARWATISGNTIARPGVGVIVSKGNSVTSPKLVTIAGNTITQSSSYGINLEFADHCNVTGNIIDDPGNRAIFHNNGGVSCLFANNSIIRTTARTSSNADGIMVTGSSHLITGNTLDFRGMTTQVGYGIYGAGATLLQIIGNRVYGSTKAIALSGGTLHTLYGNTTIESTEHSVFTSGVGSIIVDSHSFSAAAGAGVELSGASNPFPGSIFNANQNKMQDSTSRFSSSTLGLYGATPVAQAAAIATPASDTSGTKTAIDAIRAALTAIGITL